MPRGIGAAGTRAVHPANATTGLGDGFPRAPPRNKMAAFEAQLKEEKRREAQLATAQAQQAPYGAEARDQALTHAYTMDQALTHAQYAHDYVPGAQAPLWGAVAVASAAAGTPANSAGAEGAGFAAATASAAAAQANVNAYAAGPWGAATAPLSAYGGWGAVPDLAPVPRHVAQQNRLKRLGLRREARKRVASAGSKPASASVGERVTSSKPPLGKVGAMPVPVDVPAPVPSGEAVPGHFMTPDLPEPKRPSASTPSGPRSGISSRDCAVNSAAPGALCSGAPEGSSGPSGNSLSAMLSGPGDPVLRRVLDGTAGREGTAAAHALARAEAKREAKRRRLAEAKAAAKNEKKDDTNKSPEGSREGAGGASGGGSMESRLAAFLPPPARARARAIAAEQATEFSRQVAELHRLVVRQRELTEPATKGKGRAKRGSGARGSGGKGAVSKRRRGSSKAQAAAQRAAAMPAPPEASAAKAARVTEVKPSEQAAARADAKLPSTAPAQLLQQGVAAQAPPHVAAAAGAYPHGLPTSMYAIPNQQMNSWFNQNFGGAPHPVGSMGGGMGMPAQASGAMGALSSSIPIPLAIPSISNSMGWFDPAQRLGSLSFLPSMSISGVRSMGGMGSMGGLAGSMGSMGYVPQQQAQGAPSDSDGGDSVRNGTPGSTKRRGSTRDDATFCSAGGTDEGCGGANMGPTLVERQHSGGGSGSARRSSSKSGSGGSGGSGSGSEKVAPRASRATPHSGADLLQRIQDEKGILDDKAEV